MGINIENSSVVGNTAATSAGGMHVETDSTLRVTSTTVTGNRTVTGSGGVRKKKSAKAVVVVFSNPGDDSPSEKQGSLGVSSAGSCADVLLSTGSCADVLVLCLL